MESKIIPKEGNLESVFKHIFDNGFGNPIKFTSAPSLSQLKANTWGFYSTDMYIKFGDNTGLKISGTALT